MGSSPTAPTISPHETGSWAAADLALAAREALQRDGWLLTAGEAVVVRRLLDLPAPALGLYARLHMRRGSLFRLADIRYAEVPDLTLAAEQLVQAELARRGEQVLSERALALASTVEELRAAARALSLRHTGNRAELLDRLRGQPIRPLLSRPLLLLRHGGLLDRLARLYLGSRQADLQRMVLQRLAIRRYPIYTPTPGGGLFPDRRALLAWEEGLALDQRLGTLPAEQQSAALLDRLDQDLTLATRGPPPADWRARRTARHLAAGRATLAARELERRGEPTRAAEVYAALVEARAEGAGDLDHRRALALESAGQPALALALCRQALERVDPSAALALARTGRRLARALGQGFAPLPPLKSPPTRQLRLPAAGRDGARPLWQSPLGPRPLEPAVVALLADRGRVALHAEGGLWLSLFGLLFAEAILAPVPGMLPSPLRTGPLDLGSPGFAERRAAWIQPILSGLRAGEGPDRLRATWSARQGEAIAGVDWERFPLPLLVAVAADLGGVALAAVLELVAQDWRHASRGLPDLVVLAGPELRLPEAFPGRLPATALMAELKGPTDQLRDTQRLWLHRLLASGVKAELWQVQVASTSGPGR